MKGSVREAASRIIPLYNFFESNLIPIFNRQQGEILGKKTATTAVDQGEIKASFSNLNAQLGGTYNPIKIAFNLLRRIAGSTKLQRTQGELRQLKEYSGLYDNFLFANESLNFLKTKIHQEISKKEGIFSKLGIHKNKKIEADPIISELKATFKSWLQPFEQILSGGVKGVSLYRADIDFLNTIKSSLEHGNHAEYLGDLVTRLDRLLGKITKQQQKQYAAQSNQAANQGTNPQLRNPQTSRAKAQQLASLAT
jgi:hypothetical protein